MMNRIVRRLLRGWQGLRIGFRCLFLPKVCEVCGDGLVRHETYVCTGCLADFPFICVIDFSMATAVLRKFQTEVSIEGWYALFGYNKFSAYKHLIYHIKYDGCSNLGVWLGRMLGERIVGVCGADCIIPVPLHKKRERKRGFNQAYEIAKGVSQTTGIPVLNDVVVRVRNNASQTGKKSSERFDNVANVFELRGGERIRGLHVLLLDDVITTGATIGTCMEVLSKAGDVRFSLGCLALTD